MKSKNVRIFGDNTAVDLFNERSGVNYTISVLDIEQRAFIKFVLSQSIKNNTYTHIMSNDDQQKLIDKLNQFLGYEPSN